MKRALFVIVSFVFIFIVGHELKALERETSYVDFHYDRFYGDSFRVIAAYRFPVAEGLKPRDLETIKALIFNGLDHAAYTESVMREWGPAFAEKGIYRFAFDSDFWGSPAWEKLRDERRPGNALYPSFECVISFEVFDIVFSNDEFVVFRHTWEKHSSDAVRGIYGVEYKTVDLHKEKLTVLNDLLLPRALENLAPLMETLPREGMNQAGPPRKGWLPEPDSFVFEKSGVRLVWKPGATASLESGAFSVVIPYDKIASFLTREGELLARNLREEKPGGPILSE